MVPRRTKVEAKEPHRRKNGGVNQLELCLLQLSKAIDVAIGRNPRQYDGESVRRSSSPRSIVFEKREVRNVVSDKESGEKMLARDEESIIGQWSWCYLELER